MSCLIGKALSFINIFEVIWRVEWGLIQHEIDPQACWKPSGCEIGRKSTREQAEEQDGEDGMPSNWESHVDQFTKCHNELHGRALEETAQGTGFLWASELLSLWTWH